MDFTLIKGEKLLIYLLKLIWVISYEKSEEKNK